MATLNLGRIKPVFRGAYSGSTAYVVDDIVTSGNQSYICIQAHGAGAQAVSQTAYWSILAAKGTDGTDVGTTITTQGDILYRDGSGLQRLAKGTAGQALKMNSGATAPEWGTISSDFVLLSTVTASTQASVSFDGFYSATYRDYYVTISDMLPSGNDDLRYRIRQSDADYTSSDYRGWIAGSEKYSSGQNYGNQGSNWYNHNYAKISGHSSSQNTNASYGGMMGNLNIFNPLGTTGYKWIHSRHSHYSTDGTNVIGGIGVGVIQTTSASSGISFYMSSGNIVSGVFKMYGLK